LHDVLDLCDLVPDEAEERAHSGFEIGGMLDEACAAAKAKDFPTLREIKRRLEASARSPNWSYDEPDDAEVILANIPNLPPLTAKTGADLAAAIHGAWLGRCVGNTMGKPVEGLRRDEVRIYLEAVGQWPQTGYLPLMNELPAGVSHLHESAPFSTAGNFTEAPRDDDIDWTILALALAEGYGPVLTTADIAREWLDRLPFTQTFTAERAAYRNLIYGLQPPQTASIDNPYREWIGALIRADMFGYLNPGNTARAAREAVVDARLSHLGNGIYGEMWAAALVAAALATESAHTALVRALAVTPLRSRLAESQRALLDMHRSGATADAALEWVDRALGHYNWVHTINNAALISIGLLWGSDFKSSVALTISGGRDTDSNGATVGSVYGALNGLQAIPADLVVGTHVRVRSAVRGFDRALIAELADRTLALTHVRERR
jgi:ADP-ribosylglycohydrolase